MRKVNALVRHEIINLRRGKLIWIAAILYVVGVQQVISSMYTFGSTFMSLVGLIKTSWLPLNFIMIPLLLLSMNIGYSRNEVFETLDISPGEVLLSKVLTVAIVDGVILAVNILLAAVISVICKVSIGYFLYELIGYFVNTVIFLAATGSIGLFIGQVLCRYVGLVVSFITAIILFILLSNFYKTFNNIVPLIDIRTSTSSFEVISYDKGYVLQNILWLMISLILLFVMYVHLNRIKGKVKAASLQIGALIVTVAVCVALVIGIESAQPTIFNIGKRTYLEKEQKNVFDNVETFFSKEDCGYYVEKYNMNLSINNGISNNCEMNIRVNGDKVNTIELGLYKKLNISKVELDGEASKYDRTSNSFIVNLP
ncbi:MAG: hypothetical protein Q8930_08335, partial [Bacillota bacterium]|nr:hypothetical protein [Bacillota bacterium]